MNNKKIISVIGGNGFIGSYLVDSLLGQGYFVKIISTFILLKYIWNFKSLSYTREYSRLTFAELYIIS